MLSKRKLGQTGLQVSPLGLGTVKFGRNEKVHYPSAFSLPSDQEIETLLDLARASGINLLDTAPAYGHSEERLGKILAGQRDEWIIVTKAGEEFSNGESHFDFSPAALGMSVERSLKRLRTDYLDVLLIHSDGSDKKWIEGGVFETLASLKQAGKLRAYGMSTKTIEGGLLAVASADVVMVTYNPHQFAERAVIATAGQQNKGVFIKKALASGHLNKLGASADPVKTALEFVFEECAVSTVIVGTVNPEHLMHNVRCAKEVLS